MECGQSHVLDKAAHMACHLLVLGCSSQQQRPASGHRPDASSRQTRCLLQWALDQKGCAVVLHDGHCSISLSRWNQYVPAPAEEVYCPRSLAALMEAQIL